MKYFPLTHIPVIVFVYSMPFLMLGITMASELLTLETPEGRFRRFLVLPLGSLAFFGLLHGMGELVHTYAILEGRLPVWLRAAKLLMMALSFFFLSRFGLLFELKEDLSAGGGGAGTGVPGKESGSLFEKLIPFVPYVQFLSWFFLASWIFAKGHGSKASMFEGDVLSRYIIAFPGAIFAAVAFWLAARKFKGPHNPITRYWIAISVSFFLYAVFGGLIGPTVGFYPASSYNYYSFYRQIGLPVQLFRSICAVLLTVTLLGYFRAFMNLSSIRLKAITHILIAVVMPVFIVITFVWFMISGSFLRLSYSEGERLARLDTQRVLAFFTDIESRAAKDLLFLRANPPAARKSFLESFVLEDPDIKGIRFFDGNREVFRFEEGASSGAPYSSGQRVRQDPGPFLGSISGSPPGAFRLKRGRHGEPLMEMPFQGKRVELVMSAAGLKRLFGDLNIQKGWKFSVLDDRGHPVLASGQIVTSRQGGPENGGAGIPAAGARRGSAMNAGHYVIETGLAGWATRYEVTGSGLVEPAFAVFKGLMLIVFAVYISTIIMASIFVDKIKKPINLIVRKVKLIGAGDLGQRIGLKTGDELQTLSEEIEKMAVGLCEKKKLEEQMISTEKIAALGRLTAGIAHEINNPLGIILGYCQILISETEAGSGRFNDLKIIEKQTLACKKIVEDLLKFSRAHKRVEAVVDLNSVIKETIALMPPRFLTDKISIRCDLSTVSPKITGDADKLHQVFLNLMVNAMDAMKEGGVLEIATRAGEDLHVVFRDNGCGIRAEDLARIFDPFFTTKEAGKGTGLGLSVSYAIIKDHGGKIWAESEVGKGSAFHISLPLLNDHGP